MFNTLQIVKSAQTPLYLQLANGLSAFIENGQLSSGTKLPSIRSLAKQLKINRDTVVSAYKILEQRGLAYGQRGRGTFVAPLTTLQPPTLEPFSLTHKDLINFSSISLPNEYFSIEALGEMTLDLLTIKGWDAFYDYDGTKHQHLLEEISIYFKDHSIQATPSQICIIQSTSELIQSLPKFSARTGICVESPSKELCLFKQYGFETFEIPLNQDGMDMIILEQHLKTGKILYIYITPYLQNPTGICYSEQNKVKLLALAETYNAYIIENDIFSDLLLDSTGYRPLFSRSLSHNTIYVKHFSQLYLPSLHYSFVILPNTLSTTNIMSHPYNFTDSLLNSFLHSKRWQLNKQYLIDSYHEKYIALCHLIDLHLSPYLSYTCALGGIYIWLTLKTPHLSLKCFCDELISNHILICPGSLFFTDNSGISSIRLSIANVSMMQIEKGIQVMASILSGGKLK